MTYDRARIISELRDSPRFVTFTKQDGSTRVMHCTLENGVVPKTDEDYNNLPGDTVIAWDIEKKGWRQFSVGSIQRVGKTRPKAA